MTSRFLFCSDRFEETIMTNISQNEITERTVKAGFKLLATSRPDDPKIRLLMYAKLVSLFFSDTYRIYLTHRICSYYCKIMHYLMVLKSFGMVKWYFSQWGKISVHYLEPKIKEGNGIKNQIKHESEFLLRQSKFCVKEKISHQNLVINRAIRQSLKKTG